MSNQDYIGQVTRSLEAAGIPFMMAGSHSSSYYGQPRATNDLDLVIDPTEEQPMNRREFLQAGAAAAALAACRPATADAPAKPQVMTVLGPVAPEQLGVTLPHEHILVDFIGADKVSRDRYDPEQVFRTALPHLRRLKQLGGRSLLECTPAYLGRDPALLKRLAEAAGLHLLSNTGYYGAVHGKYLPEHAFTEKPEQLAARWLREWRDGIDRTGVRPGFLKIGVDAGPLTEVNRKLVRAAAQAHRESGLTVAAHTGDGVAALEELKVLRDEGVDAGAFVWVHAQNERDAALHGRAAEQGAWVEFDGVGPGTVPRHVELVLAMKQRGLLGRVLLSHDAGWYHVGEPGGGKFRPYETLFTEFLPALKKAGLTDADIQRLTVDNPREAFTLRVRTLKGR
jgi:phosphotriesterase-related protein